MDTMPKMDSAVRENYEPDLALLFRELFRHKWIILLITLIGLSLGVFYASRKVPQYQSDVLLQVDTSQSGMGRSGLPSELNVGLGGSSGNSIATQIALIQSRYVLDPLVQSLGLDITASLKKSSLMERMSFGSSTKKTITVKSFDIPNSQINLPFEVLIDKPKHVILFNKLDQMILQGKVGSVLINKSKGTRLFIQKVDAPVGTRFVLLKQPSSAVAASLGKQLKIEEVGGSRGFSSGTGILNISLSGSEPRQLVTILNAIAREAKANNAKQKAQEASQILNFLYQQLPVTKGELERAESMLNQYRSKSGKIDVKQQIQFFLAQLGALENRINELNINAIDMLQRYTKEHPSYIALESQIKSLKAQRSKLEQSLKKMPAADQVAVNLMRDVSVKRNLYLILLNKIQELQVVKAGTVSAIRVLSKAEMPNAPLPMKRAITYLGSLILSFILSVMFILGRKLFMSRVDDPRWSERHFNLPNLAIVPYSKLQTGNKSLVNSSRQSVLLAHTNPRNLSIEALRNLRTSLQLSLATSHNNVISILGISPRVGKSFVSVNTAYLLASSGKKVIVIDGDLRRGTIHKYFNAPASPGLSEVLAETVTLEKAIRPSVHESLHFLSRGAYPNDPSELLMSHSFKVLLDTLSHQYDVVIMDTAPILLVTDALIVGGLSGTNYIVFAAGAHQPQEIEMTIRRLTSAGVALNGSIFNFHKEQKKLSYGQYYSYSYSEYYDDESEKA
jgi:tyrosine-protein kinase Etk/Wzc